MDKSKKLFIVIIVLLVLLIGLIGFISFKLFSAISANEGEGANDPAVTQQSSKVAISDIQTVSLAEPISTNLKIGPSGIEYGIRVSVSMGINNTDPKAAEPLIALLTSKEVIVRDICISVITNMTYEELKAGDAQAILSNAILVRLQEEFETNLICEVYVSDIYIQ